MRSSSRIRSHLGTLLGLAVAVAAPALAARPATNVVAAPAQTAVRPTARASGRRGPIARVARREPPAPPPTTERPDADGRDSLASRHDDGRRRASDLRVTPASTACVRGRDDRLDVVARDRRTTAPASVFHDAHAPPPATVPTVAGLDA